MKITDDEFDNANQRATTIKSVFPSAVSVRYDRRVARIIISLSSNLELSFSPKNAQGLENANHADFLGAEISPSGLGIYFPKLDVDIYIPALLEGFLGSKKWLATENGRKGGKASTASKAVAARKNGKLGGRPKLKNKGLTTC
jgi:hypothetical protein